MVHKEGSGEGRTCCYRRRGGNAHIRRDTDSRGALGNKERGESECFDCAKKYKYCKGGPVARGASNKLESNGHRDEEESSGETYQSSETAPSCTGGMTVPK